MPFIYVHYVKTKILSIIQQIFSFPLLYVFPFSTVDWHKMSSLSSWKILSSMVQQPKFFQILSAPLPIPITWISTPIFSFNRCRNIF